MQGTLDDIIEPAVIALGKAYVGCEWLNNGQGQVLRVYVDSENGVSVDDCADLSHQIGAVLEVEDTIKQAYRLEVSSPGLNRPLFRLEHYTGVVGKTIKCRLRVPMSDRKNFKGTLVNIDGDILFLNVDGIEWQVDFNNIEKANLVFDF